MTLFIQPSLAATVTLCLPVIPVLWASGRSFTVTSQGSSLTVSTVHTAAHHTLRIYPCVYAALWQESHLKTATSERAADNSCDREDVSQVNTAFISDPRLTWSALTLRQAVVFLKTKESKVNPKSNITWKQQRFLRSSYRSVCVSCVIQWLRSKVRQGCTTLWDSSGKAHCSSQSCPLLAGRKIAG